MSSLIHVTRLGHVAITVRDVAATIAWYTRVLGLHQVHPEWGYAPAMMVTDANTGIAVFQRGEVEPHIALGTSRESFLAAPRILAENGIEFKHEDHGAVESIYFRDPNGQRLEITYTK